MQTMTFKFYCTCAHCLYDAARPFVEFVNLYLIQTFCKMIQFTLMVFHFVYIY